MQERGRAAHEAQPALKAIKATIWWKERSDMETSWQVEHQLSHVHR